MKEFLETGEYMGTKLRGNATLSHITSTLDGFIHSLRQRFDQSEIIKCTRITHLKNWPTFESLLQGILSKVKTCVTLIFFLFDLKN